MICATEVFWSDDQTPAQASLPDPGLIGVAQPVILFRNFIFGETIFSMYTISKSQSLCLNAFYGFISSNDQKAITFPIFYSIL